MTMADSSLTIRRGTEILGAWNKFEIRQFIDSGALLPTDEFTDPETGEWHPLLPPYRRRYSFFDWAGEEDMQWYYYKDGYMHGPRTSEEIDAFATAGFIEDADMVCFLGAPEWIAYGELSEGGADAVVAEDARHWDAAKEHVMTGNWIAAAANAGAHFLTRMPKAQNPPQLESDPNAPE